MLLHVSEMHLPSIHMCLGFGSQPDMSSWLQSYPAGVVERPRGGLSPSLSVSGSLSRPGLLSGSKSSPGSPPAGGRLPPPPPPPSSSSPPPGSGRRGCPLDVGPGFGKVGHSGPFLPGGIGVSGECLLSFLSLGHEDSGSGLGVDGLSLGVV
jgi:hypothetical protein